MRRNRVVAAAMAGLLATATPVQAQVPHLPEEQIELYAEMLAMGELCEELAGFSVQRESLYEMINERLVTALEADIEEVLGRQQAKFDSIRARADEVREMPQGGRRDRAVSAHIEDITGRCAALARHSLGSEYFYRR